MSAAGAFEIADEGSGMMIGRTAIRRSLWALEGMAPLTPLAEEVLTRFGHDAANRGRMGRQRQAGRLWQFRADGLRPRRTARSDGDRDPRGRRRSRCTRLVSRLLEVGAPTVAMIGGVFPEILPWLPPPIQAVCVEPESDAADGAILMAMRALRAREAA